MDNEIEKLEISCTYGLVASESHSFDNEKEISKMLNYKIIKIKIYLGYSKGEKVILGIGTTFQNILDGNIINTVHKVEGKVEEIEELIIKGNEYLADIQINLDQDNFYIICLRFITNKNNQLLVGEYDEENYELKIPKSSKSVIVGFYGSYGGYYKRLESIGFYYVEKEILFKEIFYGFFLLKYYLKHNKNFRDIWDKDYKKLDFSYQCLWKAVNLPDSCKYFFYLIIKYLSYF